MDEYGKVFFLPRYFPSGGKWKDEGEGESRDDQRDRGRGGQISRRRCPNIRLHIESFCCLSHSLKAHLYNCWSEERRFDLISHDCRPQESLFLPVHHLICPPFFQISSRFSLHIYLESVKCKGGCFTVTTLFKAASVGAGPQHSRSTVKCPTVFLPISLFELPLLLLLLITPLLAPHPQLPPTSNRSSE